MHRFLLVAVFIAAMPLHAQLSVGVGGGLGRIGISGDAPDGGAWAANVAFAAGLRAEWEFTPDLSLTFQPGFQGRSVTLQHTYSNGNPLNPSDTTVDSAYISTNYLAFPLGVRVYSDSHRWFFSTGAAVFALQSIEIDTLTGTYAPENVIHDYDVAIYVGAGYRIPIDPLSIVIEATYQQGILDLIGDEQVDSFRDSAVIRMSGLSIGVSAEWRFSL